MANTTYVAGALLKIDEQEDGVYKVTQLPYEVQLPKVVPGVEDDRIEIDWSFGVGKIGGYFIKSTLEIGVELYILGIKLGNFYGNLRDGLVINVNLFVEKGKVRFYLKNGNEVWIHVELDGVASYEKDIKLFSF